MRGPQQVGNNDEDLLLIVLWVNNRTFKTLNRFYVSLELGFVFILPTEKQSFECCFSLTQTTKFRLAPAGRGLHRTGLAYKLRLC